MTQIIAVGPEALGPYVPSLRRLEESITYPLDADRFRIDHGPLYHPFFSEMGEARFVMAVEGTEVLGTLALVRKRGALYLADLKVRPELRGRGLSRALALRAFKQALATPRWRFAFFAAMKGAKGDVTRSGGLLMKLLRPAARLHVYFARPDELACVPEGPSPPGPGLSLSAATPTLLVSTAGRKDLRLLSSGASWPLVHLAASPTAWGPSLGAYLRRCARAMPGDAVSCFALDERLADHASWLGAAGVKPGASCTLYGFRFPRAPWVHLATSEI